MCVCGGGNSQRVKPGTAGRKGKSVQAAFCFGAHKKTTRCHFFLLLTFDCSPSFGQRSDGAGTHFMTKYSVDLHVQILFLAYKKNHSIASDNFIEGVFGWWQLEAKGEVTN